MQLRVGACLLLRVLTEDAAVGCSTAGSVDAVLSGWVVREEIKLVIKFRLSLRSVITMRVSHVSCDQYTWRPWTAVAKLSSLSRPVNHKVMLHEPVVLIFRLCSTH